MSDKDKMNRPEAPPTSTEGQAGERDMASGGYLRRRAGEQVADGDQSGADAETRVTRWSESMRQQIDGIPEMSPAEKQQAKGQVSKIEAEMRKGSEANAFQLQVMINTLGVMAPDVFEPSVESLASTLAGMGFKVELFEGDERIRVTKS